MRFTLPPQEIISEVILQQGLLRDTGWLEKVSALSSHIALVTEERVKALWGKTIEERLARHGLTVHLFSVPPGEQSKTAQWKQWIETQMSEAGLGRECALIALGGGVLTDLAGYVAATYCRGIPFLSIPTTLLGQVDASLGGKVGINTPYGKNLIGAFYYPRWIFIDPEVLHTLPPQEIRNGMAEIIKYALIASEPLCKQIGQPINASLIRESCAIKKRIVEQDPQEQGLRRILNFGHTVGHALETLSAYQMPHGEAVALGLLAESYLSYRLGYLPENAWHKICHLIEGQGFILRPLNTFTESAFKEAMRRDKKASASTPRFVLLKNIGEPLSFEGAYCRAVDPSLLQELYTWLCSR